MTAPEQTVLIVAARCEKCGKEFRGQAGRGGAIPFRMPIYEAKVRNVHTPTCGGQVLLSQALPGEEGM